MASGDLLHRFQGVDGLPPSSAFASAVRRNNHYLQQFDATTEQALDFGDVLDRKYAGGGITVILSWMAATATTNSVVWEGKFERHDDEGLDLDADSFGTAKTVTSAAPLTSGFLQYATLTFTNAEIDGLLIGEDFRFRLSRKPADISDTMTGFAQLKGLEVRET